jgi:hypothetical protein
VEPYLSRVAEDTLAAAVHRAAGPMDAASVTQQITGGEVVLAVRRVGTAG